MQAPESDDRFPASLTQAGRYRLLVEAVTDYAIYMLDPDGFVTSWNAGARRFKGYEEAEVLGEHFSRFYTEEDRRAGRPERALATAAREGSFEGEGWRVRKDRTRFWASVVIDRISDPGGTGASVRAASDSGPTWSSTQSMTIPASSPDLPRSPATLLNGVTPSSHSKRPARRYYNLRRWKPSDN